MRLRRAGVKAIGIADRDWDLPSLRRKLRPTGSRSGPGAAKRSTTPAHTYRPEGVSIFLRWSTPIENFLVSLLCKTPITPNQLTATTNIAAWGDLPFYPGRLGWGTILALVVGVLDGLDGKQARVKIKASKLGSSSIGSTRSSKTPGGLRSPIIFKVPDDSPLLLVIGRF